MVYNLEFYKQQFKALNKENLFEVNKPFLEELIKIKTRIDYIEELSGGLFILQHPTLPGVTKVPTHEQHLLTLQRTYKDMILVLNKILGDVAGEEKSALERYLDGNRSDE